MTDDIRFSDLGLGIFALQAALRQRDEELAKVTGEREALRERVEAVIPASMGDSSPADVRRRIREALRAASPGKEA